MEEILASLPRSFQKINKVHQKFERPETAQWVRGDGVRCAMSASNARLSPDRRQKLSRYTHMLLTLRVLNNRVPRPTTGPLTITKTHTALTRIDPECAVEACRNLKGHMLS